MPNFGNDLGVQLPLKLNLTLLARAAVAIEALCEVGNGDRPEALSTDRALRLAGALRIPIAGDFGICFSGQLSGLIHGNIRNGPDLDSPLASWLSSVSNKPRPRALRSNQRAEALYLGIPDAAVEFFRVRLSVGAQDLFLKLVSDFPNHFDGFEMVGPGRLELPTS